MFQLSVQQIHLAASAPDKQQAIRLVAEALTQAGCVAEDYVSGMLAREGQISTYLGNGIAIPHGTTDSRDQVLRTGVQVFQFPQGVDWGEGNVAYLVIGIAARSDEHLELLRQLTRVLSDDSVSARLKTIDSPQALCDLLQGKDSGTRLRLDQSLLSLAVQTDDMLTLQALNAGRLKAAGAVNSEFISQLMSSPPLDLGQGIWFNDSPQGNLASAVAISRPATPFRWQGQPVAMLISVAAADEQAKTVLYRLSQLLLQQQGSRLCHADGAEIVALLTSEGSPDSAASAAESASATSTMTVSATTTSTTTSTTTASTTIASTTTTSTTTTSADTTSASATTLADTTAGADNASDLLSADFVIRNAHGLHARPGAMLVNTIKQFTSEIKVANLDGDGTAVNGRSLMKVVALGVKQGHRLRFTAKGDDAQLALQSIGEAIQQKLGEGAA